MGTCPLLSDRLRRFARRFQPRALSIPRRRALVRHMLKNNVPAPSCIPPAGSEVLTKRHVNGALSELHPRSGLEVLKGRPNCA